MSEKEFNPKTDFRFVMGEKNELVLVLFYGRISNRELASLEEIERILKEKTQKIFLFNFHDVSSVMPAAHQFLAKFQKGFRDAGKHIGICCLHPDVKASLLQSGIIRDSEVYNNIPDAWKALHYKAQTAAQKAPAKANDVKQAA